MLRVGFSPSRPCGNLLHCDCGCKVDLKNACGQELLCLSYFSFRTASCLQDARTIPLGEFFKRLRGLQREMAEFMEFCTLVRFDQEKPLKIRMVYADLLVILEYFMSLISWHGLSSSSFHSHRRLWHFFFTFNSFMGDLKDDRIKHELLDSCVYMIWSFRSTQFYVGQTSNDFANRKPTSKEPALP